MISKAVSDTEFDISRYLARLPLFKRLSAAELQCLAQASVRCQFNRWDLVLQRGQPRSAFYLVVSGRIKVFAQSSPDQERVVELVGPGQSFGQALMFSNQPCALNAQALVRSELLALSKRALLQAAKANPLFGLDLLADMSQRLNGLVNELSAGSLHNGMQRVVQYLLRELQREPPTADSSPVVRLPASKSTIASQLSLTPEYFSRMLHKLRAENLIEVDKRLIRILQPDQLANYASSAVTGTTS